MSQGLNRFCSLWSGFQGAAGLGLRGTERWELHVKVDTARMPSVATKKNLLFKEQV